MVRAVAYALSFAVAVVSVMGPVQAGPADARDEVRAAAAVSSGVVISEFYPNALCDDEYFVLTNPSSNAVSIAGWEVTDQEGAVRFDGSWFIAPHASLSVSFNASSYSAVYGLQPSVHVGDPSSWDGVAVVGSFRLGNDGDSLLLKDDRGTVLDAVVYGDCDETSLGWSGPPLPAPRPGEVVARMKSPGGLVDTGSPSDWMPFREHRYGYSSWQPFAAVVAPGNLTAFLSPDCSADVVVSRLDSARESIRMCSYEFSSSLVCHALLRALGRGVDVSVIVDGAPAGGMDERALVALSVLVGAGGSARTLSGRTDDGVVRHIAALHSKYFVIDSVEIIVLSENAVPSGIPSDRVFGNRGWGVAIASEELATHLASVFEDDRRSSRPDVADWSSDPRFDPEAEPPAEERSEHERGMIPPLVTTADAVVNLVLSPDGSFATPFLSDMLVTSEDLVIEQFQADLRWLTRWSDDEILSPLLSCVIESARSGASCRALLDSSWFNLERNGEVVDALSAVRVGESVDCESRLMDLDSPITVLHNKGVIIDGQRTVVSSNNWGYASFARNRELAAVVDSLEVARYFTRAFDADWHPDTVAPVIDVPRDVVATTGTWVTLSSEGCYDDRLLVDISWDVDGDGSEEARTPSVSFLVVTPGEIIVVLTLKDSWGNEASESISVRVVSGYPPPQEERSSATAYLAVIPGVLGVALLLAFRRRGRRRG
jgi:cardiolipin synthase